MPGGKYIVGQKRVADFLPDAGRGSGVLVQLDIYVEHSSVSVMVSPRTD